MKIKQVIRAVKKAIPKNPHFSLFNGCFWCPECERLIKHKVEDDSEINISYCPYCGQALDWGDTDNR